MNKISGLRLFIEGLFEQGKELTTKEVISAVRMQLPNEKVNWKIKFQSIHPKTGT